MFEIKSINNNIIDIEETEFQEIIKFVNDNLIGHEKFKLGLEKELKNTDYLINWDTTLFFGIYMWKIRYWKDRSSANST